VKSISEAEFLKQVLELARVRGWFSAHFRPGRTASGGWRTAVQGNGAGFPDLVLVRLAGPGPGSERKSGYVIIFAELKRSPKEKLRPDQIDWMEAIGVAADYCDGAVLSTVWTPADWPAIERSLE
jgi:hypothetical protein